MELVRNKQKLLRSQPIMRHVLLALLPCIIGAIYYFGWRALFIILVANLVGFVTELIFARCYNRTVSEAVFVTSTLFALVMPASVPWYVLIIGIIFAVAFAKEVFGGFGKNIFNPALAGRAFVYVCFPVALTANWPPVAQGPMGALNKWSTFKSTDAISQASPMAYLKAGQIRLTDTAGVQNKSNDTIPHIIPKDKQVHISRSTLLKGLLSGRISGTMGVTSAILICIGGIYLFITKTASRAIILSTILTYAFWNELLYRLGVEPVPGALPAVLGGGFLFGAFFMATDPISSPRTTAARIIYGIIIATCTTVIRNFSIFNGGLMFSILIGNMFAPILDYTVKALKNRY